MQLSFALTLNKLFVTQLDHNLRIALRVDTEFRSTVQFFQKMITVCPIKVLYRQDLKENPQVFG